MQKLKEMFKKYQSKVLIILVTIMIMHLLYNGFNNEDFVSQVEFGSTLSSIILSVIAIIYTLVESQDSKIVSGKLIDSANSMKSNVDQLDKSINILTNISEILEDNKLYATLESIKNDTNLIREIKSKLEEEYLKKIEKVKNTHNFNGNTDMQKHEKYSESPKRSMYSRGDIFFADTNWGVRPVIIIQNDIGNKYSPTITVASITSQINKGKLPTHVEISSDEYGLNKDSVVLLEQISTLDRKRFKTKIGHLTDNDKEKVDTALLIQMGL